MVMKGSIFWDTRMCSLLKANQHFGGTCYIHLLDRKTSQVRSQATPQLRRLFAGFKLPGKVLWDLWQTKREWSGFSQSTSVSPANNPLIAPQQQQQQ
jgi:hypothetical protein